MYVKPLYPALDKVQWSVTCSVTIYDTESEKSLVPLHMNTVGSVHRCTGPVRPFHRQFPTAKTGNREAKTVVANEKSDTAVQNRIPAVYVITFPTVQ